MMYAKGIRAFLLAVCLCAVCVRQPGSRSDSAAAASHHAAAVCETRGVDKVFFDVSLGSRLCHSGGTCQQWAGIHSTTAMPQDTGTTLPFPRKRALATSITIYEG